PCDEQCRPRAREHGGGAWPPARRSDAQAHGDACRGLVMSEWWTYRLSDFLMFAPRTYYRLFELYNTEIWPLPILTLPPGAAMLWMIWRGGTMSGHVAGVILGAAWLFVGWAYHWQRYMDINWGAEYYAAGFAVEGLLLIGFGAAGALHLRRPGTNSPIA